VGWAGKEALVPSLAYVLLNVAYSLWAKDLVILDVLVVSAGFLLRVVAGGSLAGVHLSPWLLACTFLLSLTLALGKRRGELTSLEAGAAVHRRVMSDYSARFLDQMIAVVGSVTITCYILYTLLSESGQANPYLFVSVLPVVYGLLRYFYLVYHHGGGEAPEALPVNDRPLLAAIVLWLAAVGVALYI
jgi:4-hydroxybenzoate polyprenyltransferase